MGVEICKLTFEMINVVPSLASRSLLEKILVKEVQIVEVIWLFIAL